jgi:chromosome segregation ATPase
LRASEKRALMEIDRERQAAAQWAHRLDEAVKRADQREADHRAVVQSAQAQLQDAQTQLAAVQMELRDERVQLLGAHTSLGEARHEAGVLLGRLNASEAEASRLAEELATLRRETTSKPDTHQASLDRTQAVRKTSPTRGSAKGTRVRKL